MVADLIEASLVTGTTSVRLSTPVAQAVTELRDWLFHHVYHAAPVSDDFHKASHVLRELFNYFVAHPAELTACGGRRAEEDPVDVAVADFLAGMTDRYAMNLYQRLFLPQSWKVL
jgi:dGTPase